ARPGSEVLSVQLYRAVADALWGRVAALGLIMVAISPTLVLIANGLASRFSRMGKAGCRRRAAAAGPWPWPAALATPSGRETKAKPAHSGAGLALSALARACPARRQTSPATQPRGSPAAPDRTDGSPGVRGMGRMMANFSVTLTWRPGGTGSGEVDRERDGR